MENKHYTISAEKKDTIRRIIVEILTKTQNIHFSYLFGSFIEEENPFRDIDLGIFFAGGNRVQMHDAAIDLAVGMTRKTGYPVDVRVLNYAPVTFVYNVLRGELIYERNEETRCRVMEHTVRTYLDMKPILHLATKEAFLP